MTAKKCTKLDARAKLLFCQSNGEEDPSTWKMLDGGTIFRWVFMQKFRSVLVITMQVEKELKVAANKNEKGNFGPIGSLYWRQ